MNAPMCNDTHEAYDLAKKINTLFKKEYSTRKEKPIQICRALIGDVYLTDDEGNPISIDNKDSEDNEGKTCSSNTTDFNTGIEAFSEWSIQKAIETSISTSSESSTREDLGIISDFPRVEEGNANWLKSTGLSVKINSLTLALHNYVKAKI